jgi:hypothetical protein
MEGERAMADHYVVEKSVGPHEPGELIEVTDEHRAKGHDPDRLVRRGFLRQATAADRKERQPTPIGISSNPERNMRRIEPVQATPAGAAPQGAGGRGQATEDETDEGAGSSRSSKSGSSSGSARSSASR